ncbi:NADH-cytochrome b5 reductase [Mycena floridula]|nr:NADH-cytochrome b5 reductase [Mycena floridula]
MISTVAEQGRSPLDSENFVQFKLKKVEQYNHNTAKFFFELPNNEASLLPVASCVIVKASDPEALKDPNGNPTIRAYTPISASDAKGELVFMIKRYEAGNASKYIHSLKPGDTLSIKGPFPKWPYKVNEYEEVALVGGGSGITPLYQVLTYALSAPNNRTKFTLLFSNVTEVDILLREELDALKEKYPSNLAVIYVLSAPPQGWTGPSGHISKELIKQHISPPNDKLKVFICGPPPQVASLAGLKDGTNQGELRGIFKELGYTENQVRHYVRRDPFCAA